jgi:hypothetical protein
LASRREPSANGVNPILFREIEAWKNLMGVPIKPWEVRLLGYMDMAVTKKLAEDAAARADAPPNQIPMKNVGALAAMFANLKVRQDAKFNQG